MKTKFKKIAILLNWSRNFRFLKRLSPLSRRVTIFTLFALVLVSLLIFSFFIYADQTETWPFTTAGNYTVSDSTRVEVADGVAKLKLVDQTDNTQAEIDSGTKNKTQWSTDHLELTSSGKTDGAGDFTSRKIDAGGSVSWSSLDWTPKRPYWKELPDSKGVEAGYTEGNVNMSNNVGLWHLNESSGAIADSCGESNNGTYNGSLYSQTGKFNTAIGFDGDDDYVNVPYDSSLDLTSEATLEAWVKLNLPTAIDVSAGGFHACAVLSDGTVKCWGDNSHGQLGDGTTDTSYTPVSVSGISTATAVTTSYYHTCAVLSDKTIKCWGYNAWGQLGDGTTTQRTTPVSVSGISTATAVTTTYYHTCAVLSDGVAKCWGYNGHGQLGDGTTDTSYTPVSVSGISTATAISATTGRYGGYTCTVLSGGAVKCWGVNNFGQLGDGTTNNSTTPVQVKGIGGVGYINNATAISVGTSAACCGGDSSCARLSTGKINCWGYNSFGQLGDGTTNTSYTPVEVLNISTATTISAGGHYACAVLSDGTAKCWGNNTNGQLGDGTTTQRTTPVSVLGISTATTISAGSTDALYSKNSHACVVLSDGTVKCWGGNNYGQLGNGTFNGSYVPVSVSEITTVTAISAGYSHTCAVLSDGTIKCWGYNNYGQLGNGVTVTMKTPVSVSGISTATAVSVGTGRYGGYTCTVLSDGAVKCWGVNNYGQLGDGTTNNSTTPVQVKGIGGVGYINNATAISVGATTGCCVGDFTCARLSTGKINCWGYNGLGGLGDGTTVDKHTPVEVLDISTAATISAGAYYACSVLSDSTAKCWGYNAYGQLGDGTTTQRTTPVSVLGISTATTISAGSTDGTYSKNSHTCAVLSDDTVKCWGGNNHGQLGNGTFANSLTPVEVLNISTATTISVGSYYTCAVLSDGTVKCWGTNGYYGKLGVGDELDAYKTTPNLVLPVEIAGRMKNIYGLFADWGSNAIGCINEECISGSVGSGAWHHLVFTYNGSKQYIYIDGQKGEDVGQLSVSINTFILDNLKIGRGFKGEIDEVAVYSTALSADEVLDHYKRGALRIKYQVRTDDDDSSWPDFYGPAGPGDTGNYYSELSNNTTSPPSISLTNVANNRYFQYKAFLETDSSSYTPEVSSIAFGPAHYPAEGPTVVNSNGLAYGNVSHLAQALGSGNEGTVEYQVSNNNTNWYYYNTGTTDWTEQTGQDYPNETNPASELTDEVIATFDNDIHPAVAGDFYFKAFLVSDGTQKAELSNLEVSYVYDSQKPTNSPPPASGYSDSGKGTSLTSGDWYNHPAPYFTFSAGTDTPLESSEEIASGIEGYWVYLDTASHAIPQNSGVWQAGNQEADRVYQSDLSSAPSGVYYLRIQSKDIAQNEAEYTSSTLSLFIYNYDAIAPSPPDFVTVIPQGYASTNEFTFVWPIAEDADSGIAGYCYKTGDPDFPDEEAACGDDGKFITDTSISTDPTDGDPDVEAYQDGENIFYARSKDNAGNYGDWIQTTYYFSTSAPSPPQSLTVAPETTSDSPSTTNSFAFSWAKPATYTGDIKGYYYSVNAKPTPDNTASTTSASLASGPFAASQGKNTFYVAAKDTAGNINWDGHSSVDFYCETSAPPIPSGVTIADSSNREEKKYALTITWTKPKDLDEDTFSHYVIERAIDSADSENFEDTAHTEALGYLDTGLENTKTYYYRIKACDNAGSCSSPSSVVYLKPTGKYTTPPEIIVLPEVSPRISSATVTWKTDREASSFVQFGKTKDLGEEQGISELKEEHEITIVALSANTEYYYRVKSEGIDGNIAYSQISTFKTADAPSAPTDLKVSPSTSKKKPASENSFTFSWSKPPDPGITIKGYWYSVNDLPSKTTATYTTKTKAGPYSFATRQDENVFYIVAQDDKGNVNFKNLAKISFFCETKAPGIPKSINIVDASDRDAKRYQLTVNWDPPKEKGAGIDKYVIERAESKAAAEKASSTAADLTFTQIATVPGTSTGYLDTNLDSSKVYSYRVKASDNAGALSSPSSEVSLRPEGRYTTPPTISNVKLEPRSFGAKVTWKTDRPTTSHVQFGKKSTEEKEQGVEELVEEHEITIVGLDPETTYIYRVKSKDRDENINYSDTSTFKTLEAPKVSEVSVSDITLTGATISWKTNLITTSKIEYGATTDYGSLVYDTSESKVTSHTLKLASLSSGTDYHYRIGGVDLYENTVLSDDYTFATPPYPRVISQSTENKQEGQTEVRWTTNVATTSEVEYWSEEADIAPKTQGATPKVTEHSILLFGLEDDTTYQFRLRGRDQFGNEAVSDTFTFHTLKDTTPPIITEVYSESNVLGYGEKQKVQIIVAWKTNEPASSKVYYGEGVTGDFTGETEEFGDLVLEHLVVISDLEPSKIYHFKVESFDKARNSSASETFTVLTSRKRESFLQLIVGVLEDTFAWVRNIKF